MGDFSTEPTDALSNFCEIYNFRNLIRIRLVSKIQTNQVVLI